MKMCKHATHKKKNVDVDVELMTMMMETMPQSFLFALFLPPSFLHLDRDGARIPRSHHCASC